MSKKDEFVIVGKNVYAATLQLLQTAADTKEDPVILVKRIIDDSRKANDETATRLWGEVETFIVRTGVKTIEQLIPLSPSDSAH